MAFSGPPGFYGSHRGSTGDPGGIHRGSTGDPPGIQGGSTGDFRESSQPVLGGVRGGYCLVNEVTVWLTGDSNTLDRS